MFYLNDKPKTIRSIFHYNRQISILYWRIFQYPENITFSRIIPQCYQINSSTCKLREHFWAAFLLIPFLAGNANPTSTLVDKVLRNLFNRLPNFLHTVKSLLNKHSLPSLQFWDSLHHLINKALFRAQRKYLQIFQNPPNSSFYIKQLKAAMIFYRCFEEFACFANLSRLHYWKNF